MPRAPSTAGIGDSGLPAGESVVSSPYSASGSVFALVHAGEPATCEHASLCDSLYFLKDFLSFDAAMGDTMPSCSAPHPHLCDAFPCHGATGLRLAQVWTMPARCRSDTGTRCARNFTVTVTGFARHSCVYETVVSPSNWFIVNTR
jgi:hypothetical protein